jgi:hypothetical protein
LIIGRIKTRSLVFSLETTLRHYVQLDADDWTFKAGSARWHHLRARDHQPVRLRFMPPPAEYAL